MKALSPLSFFTRAGAVLLLAGAFLAGTTANSGAGQAEIDELHAQAQRLMEKARVLKAEGALEKSEQAAAEAQMLKEKAVRLANQPREKQEPRPGPERERAGRLEELRAKARELAAAGRNDDVARVKKEISQLEGQGRGPAPDKRANLAREIEQMKGEVVELRRQGQHDKAERLEQKIRATASQLQAPERAGRPGQPEPKRDRPGQPPGPEETERQLMHIQVAVDNLHAAGWHDPANRLAQDAEKLRQQLRERRDQGPRRPEGQGDVIGNLKAEIEELRQAVREMRQRLERLGR